MKQAVRNFDYDGMPSFNWTKVELKPKKTDAATDALKTFNWTKVELKPDILAYDIILGGTFNWTKVELKLCWPRT